MRAAATRAARRSFMRRRIEGEAAAGTAYAVPAAAGLEPGTTYHWYLTPRDRDGRWAYAPAEGIFAVARRGRLADGAGGAAKLRAPQRGSEPSRRSRPPPPARGARPAPPAARRRPLTAMATIGFAPLDLATRAPFGISRWSHSEFADFVVTMTDENGLTGFGEGAPNARYQESRDDDAVALEELSGALEAVEGVAAVEAFCARAARLPRAARRPLGRRLGPRRQAGRRAGLAAPRSRARRRADLAHHPHRRPRDHARPGARGRRLRHPQDQARLRRRPRRRARAWRASCPTGAFATTRTRAGTASARRAPSRSSPA